MSHRSEFLSVHDRFEISGFDQTKTTYYQEELVGLRGNCLPADARVATGPGSGPQQSDSTTSI